MDKTALGNRMKNFYEAVPKTFLIRKIPVIIVGSKAPDNSKKQNNNSIKNVDIICKEKK